MNLGSLLSLVILLTVNDCLPPLLLVVVVPISVVVISDFLASLAAVPERYDIKPGNIGRIHGDKNEPSPANAETNTLANAQISSVSDAARIVWQDDTLGDSDIFFKASGNEGATFGSTKNLSNNDGDSSVPQIISSGGNIYVVWQDDTPGNLHIFQEGC